MNLSELLGNIQEEMTVKKSWESGDYLSELLVRLASYYATLGPLLAGAEEAMDAAELGYKLWREGHKVDRITAGDGVALADSKAQVESAELQSGYVTAKHKYRLLFTTRQSLEKNMDSIRSRLKYLAAEKESS